MIEMIASDMDGTLLDNEMKVTKENAETIKAAQKKGVHFLVATGRSHTEALPPLQEAGINCPMITVNGAQAFDQEGKELFCFALDKQQTKTIINILTKAGLYFEIATTNGVYSLDQEARFENAIQLLMNHYQGYTEEQARTFAPEHLEQLPVHFLNSYDELLMDPNISALKFIVFAYNHKERFIQAQEEIAALADVAVTSSFEGNFEINHSEAQKGTAVTRYAKTLNIQPENIMTLGDNLNDLSMLKITNYSVAMGNAAAETKEIAHYLTETNENSGVAKAIQNLLKLS